MNNAQVSYIEKYELHVPLDIDQCLFFIGNSAKNVPYANNEGIIAEALCKEIAGKIKNKKVIVPIKVVDILVKIVDQERKAGNDNTIKDIDKLIKLLKGGVDRKIIGILLHQLQMDKFKETDNGDLKTEIIIPRKDVEKVK
jgi:hypothetical protein